MTGYDCPICKNKGVTYFLENGYEKSRECKCMAIRRSIWNIKKSGLKNLLQKYTFDNFKAADEWQRDFKADAQRFVTDHNGKWFYAGGQVGAGKTHICTAIVQAFLKKGIAARYMLWRDEVVRLKAIVNDDEEYAKAINPLKTVPVLYIDDFFKTGDELDRYGNIVKKRPTQGDINVAFELLNYRYNNDQLVTIISSERTIEEILSCDEAVGSRIYQRTKDYCWVLTAPKAKNYRLM
ncbi:ATP-binding protein [Caproiciproducens galactitolivorans]|uniref:ATP-binding protein n=1 Tax=Caproiciproducens galactitolivorans TaxID=642589 RepID=A0ABT4BWD0_9FIRM|nr:ATP-binding protein [Caproiciproducens galactitolivorans]MCY1715202.1 ATP-binding protein [Caproiciproducens galactitolivorans]